MDDSLALIRQKYPEFFTIDHVEEDDYELKDFKIDTKEEEEIEYDVDFGAYIEEFKNLARDIILKFFRTPSVKSEDYNPLDKDWVCGGPVPESILLTEKNISLVLNVDVVEGIDVAYEILKDNGINCEAEDEEGVSEDQLIVLKVMNECRNLKIPKWMKNGLLLMYLEYCMGFNFLDELE